MSRPVWRWLRAVFVASAAAWLLTAAATAAHQTPPPARGKDEGKTGIALGICDREAPRLLGQTAVRLDQGIPVPKRLRDAKPIWPIETPAHAGRGNWVGEALIGQDGRIRAVWALREPILSPPLPAFSRAIVTAIKRWVFEPTLVGGRAVPVCLTVTVNIEWE